MCGFAGYLDPAAGGRDATLVAAMAATLRHRGPDAAGSWQDARHGLAFGHQRLAVIDVSAAGHQPMMSADGRYVLVLNGEIYNHRVLRDALHGYPFRGHSDTEVLLALIEQDGFRSALTRAAGMFALALWDREAARLYLARDRIGEKPLYYAKLGSAWLFGSELRALRRHPHWAQEVDRGALAALLRGASIPAPATIYQDVRKLKAGHYLALTATDDYVSTAQQPYWSIENVAQAGTGSREFTAADAAVDATEACLREVIEEQLIADVPTGAFLSGGIDSSTIAALAQSLHGDRLRTFSIGFREAGFDEAQHAAEVAAHLDTEHHTLYVTPSDALDLVPDLPRIYDEPFADSSQIPTALLARLTREHVTVALSGDGADEVFGGYSRYSTGLEAWAALQRLPRAARASLRYVGATVPEARLDRVFAAAAKLLPRSLRFTQPGDKLRKLAALAGVDGEAGYYDLLVSHWQDPAVALCADLREPMQARPRVLENFSAQMMLWDTQGYLVDDILTKVDRASMAASLEVRCPYLDHRLVELAWRLPANCRIRRQTGKWVLRQILARHVPPAITDRPKTGFAVPVADWLRDPLRDWAEHLLDEQRLREQGFFVPRVVQEVWQRHRDGRQNEVRRLWPVLMFQAWWEQYGNAP